jgi:hypothetical protein
MLCFTGLFSAHPLRLRASAAKNTWIWPIFGILAQSPVVGAVGAEVERDHVVADVERAGVEVVPNRKARFHR